MAAAPVAVNDPERPIGDILVSNGALTAEQLSKALRIQSKLEEWKTLGAVLVDLGLVPRAKVEEAIKESRRALSIEEILVQRGLLHPDQLAAAVQALGGRTDTTPARHLVDAGTITERAYLEAFCEKQGLPFIEVDANLVDRAVLAKANLKYLARLRVLPLSVQDGRLNVAMEKPAAPPVLAELQRIFGAPVNIWIGEPSRMTSALAELEAEASGKTDLSMSAVQYRNVAQVTDEQRSASEILDTIILRGIRQGASDIHIDPDRTRMRVRFRVDGELVRVAEYPSSQVTGDDLAAQGAGQGRHRRAARPPAGAHLRPHRRRRDRHPRLVLRDGARRERGAAPAAQDLGARRPAGHGLLARGCSARSSTTCSSRAAACCW